MKAMLRKAYNPKRATLERRWWLVREPHPPVDWRHFLYRGVVKYNLDEYEVSEVHELSEFWI
jgi:hypothetical protein